MARGMEHCVGRAAQHQCLTSEDCENTAKPSRRPEGITEHEFAPMKGGTAHWVSEYRASTAQATSGSMAGQSPRSQPRCGAKQKAPCIGYTEDSSTYQADYGKYGSNPRDRIAVDDVALPVNKSALTAGTTKGTCHVPGYQGYIPINTTTPEVAEAEKGETVRSVDKTNLSQTFHQNMVGYAGHCPASARNDRGSRRPTEMTTFGRDFCDLSARELRAGTSVAG